MANEPKLVGEKRTKLGTAENRRLRRRGVVPGNVYGHGDDPVAVAVPAEALTPVIESGARVIDLEVDGQVQKTILRELQWDTFGMEIQHFDLLRVDPNERVVVEVPIELRGIAPGVLAGGMLEQALRSLSLECPAVQIPDVVSVRINNLQIGDSVHVAGLDLADNWVCHTPADQIVVQVIELGDQAPAGEEAGVAGEPELVGHDESSEGNE
jgi:large subunit ribosomal protein L25